MQFSVNMKKIDFLKIYILIGSLIILDQVTKTVIVGNFFNLKYSQNTGIAFGIPVPAILLIIMSVLLIILVIIFARKELNINSQITQAAVALILSGAVGNLLDRTIRGFVVDFINIWKWPSFNLADAFIVIGILMIVVFHKKISKKA